MTVRVVAELQCETPLESLAVGNPRLGLDARAPRGWVPAGNLRIPGPEVTLDRQRRFGSPAQAWVEPCPEPFEERQLRTIPNRISGRVRTDRQLKPDDRKR